MKYHIEFGDGKKHGKRHRKIWKNWTENPLRFKDANDSMFELERMYTGYRFRVVAAPAGEKAVTNGN